MQTLLCKVISACNFLCYIGYVCEAKKITWIMCKFMYSI